jgi:hypothetical protein
MSKALGRFMTVGRNLQALDHKIKMLTITRDAHQQTMGELLPEALPAILKGLNTNAAGLVKKINRTHQALSNAIKDKNASMPMLLGILQVLAGKKPDMPKTTRKKRS